MLPEREQQDCMKLGSHSSPIHLTYCLNVHPGETWPENIEAMQTHTLAVRDAVCPDAPFGLGLRLGARAARELADPSNEDAFKAFLQEHNLYVYTINGFPYGRFHGGRVKERVYQPDWTTDARRDYTLDLAERLAALLPDGQDGSISTLPGAYKLLVREDRDPEIMAQKMMDCVARLAELHRETGRELHLGLEPEPACFLEMTDEVIAFYNQVLLDHGRAYLSRISGEGADTAEEWIRRHLGVCLDTCHAALQFEDPASCLERYAREGVRVSKVQLSAALETANTESARRALRPFDEPVYLHQTRARCVDGRLLRWNDLSDALTALPRQPMAETVRIHFHVPLCWAGAPPLGTTAAGLDARFWNALQQGACPHLEIETYTFDVLPETLKSGPVNDSIAREFQWTLERLT